MTASGVVPAFDELEDGHARLGLGPERPAVEQLAFEGGEEALHRCVIPAVAGTAHRAGYAVIGHQTLELIAGVVAP